MHHHAAPAATPATAADLDALIARVSHWLPSQGPIKDFIHHNTLHAFQDLPFTDGVVAAARLHGARAVMPLRFFREAHAAGQISPAAMERALERAFADPSERAVAHEKMLSGALSEPSFPGAARGGLRAQWVPRLGGVPLHRRSQLQLFRLVGGYLDQGLAMWRMPAADRLGFYDCVVSLARESLLPLQPFDTRAARELLELPAREALWGALVRTVGRPELFEAYLLESLLSQPGWSGLVGECERKPGDLLSPRKATLLDFAAVLLVAEVGCLERELGSNFEPLGAALPRECSPLQPGQVPARSEAERLGVIWHEALEWSYYEQVLGALSANLARAPRARAAPTAWAFFCIDDRACSIRRHLEEVAPDVATLGTAGFFGLDFLYRGAGDAVAGKHCPAPMQPRHLIEEELESNAPPPADDLPWWRRALQLEAHSNTFFRGWLLSYALGLGAAARLAASVFKPSLAPVVVPPLSTVSGASHFRLVREGDARTAEGLWQGYSAEELADRVEGVLRSTGADRDWPELVVVFGHGASSVNNPYFAAYNCGACSGRTGAPNARAFAKAANRPEVRAALRARGLEIPDSTWFVGALLDTTRDEASYYDLERVPERLRPAVERFRASFEEALARNAAERCRRFAEVPLAITPRRALEEVQQRAVSLFQPRPEYNHATNASCVVGRRALTAGLFLDRRAFLSSYDPARDPEGVLLTGVLSAVIPVCAGINLEYLFSRLDPDVYGAGTKLPHNVNGLLGVCNGIEGDLLTGLPTQMTEIHDPVRLMVVIDHAPAVALAAAQRNPAVFEWIEKAWVHYACVDPATREVFLYQDHQMVRVDGLHAPGWAWPSSLDAARTGRGNLPVGFIQERAPALERAT